MTTPLSDEVRTHADRTHRRKLTRAARGWLAALLVGVLLWGLLIILALYALQVAP